MALDIQGASIGYDVQGIKDLMDQIHTEVVSKTIDKMHAKESEIETWVSDAWVGQSADNFVSNLKGYQGELEKVLNKAEAGLKSEFSQIQSEIKNADNELIKKEF